MSDSKWTKGPWKHYSAPLRKGLATINEVQGADGSVVFHWTGVDAADGSKKRKRANCRLASSAPTMYEALKLAELWLANCVPACDMEGPKPLPIIRAALLSALPEGGKK